MLRFEFPIDLGAFDTKKPPKGSAPGATFVGGRYRKPNASLRGFLARRGQRAGIVDPGRLEHGCVGSSERARTLLPVLKSQTEPACGSSALITVRLLRVKKKRSSGRATTYFRLPREQTSPAMTGGSEMATSGVWRQHVRLNAKESASGTLAPSGPPPTSRFLRA